MKFGYFISEEVSKVVQQRKCLENSHVMVIKVYDEVVVC